MTHPPDSDHCGWYLAWHPDFRIGVVRAKDAAGLAEWRSRRWHDFPSVEPRITDVSDDMAYIAAALAARPWSAFQVVGVVRDGEAALEIRSGAACRPVHVDELDVEKWFVEAWRDLVRSGRSRLWTVRDGKNWREYLRAEGGRIPTPTSLKALSRESEPEVRIGACCTACGAQYWQNTTRNAVHLALGAAADRMDGDFADRIRREVAMLRQIAESCGVELDA